MVGVSRVVQMTLVATLGFAGLAMADEQMTPLAVSGNWVALAHQPSMIGPADVCLVAEATGGVALRASGGGIQLRIVNEKWSLPANVKGDIAMSVGNWKTTFEIDDNTNDMINAEVPPEIVDPMFAAMDKAASMSLAVGNAKPLLVSLSGSTRATNAFRTCAGLKGNVTSPGSNPFQ